VHKLAILNPTDRAIKAMTAINLKITANKVEDHLRREFKNAFSDLQAISIIEVAKKMNMHELADDLQKELDKQLSTIAI
jgi:homoserine acetyltransferase